MRRSGGIVLRGLAVIVAVLAVIGGYGAWQVYYGQGLPLGSAGPWLLNVIERYSAGNRIEARDLVLRRGPGGLALGMSDLKITASDGRRVATAPEVAVDFDIWRTLVERAIRIERLTVVEPSVTLVRRASGHIELQSDSLPADTLTLDAGSEGTQGGLYDLLAAILPAEGTVAQSGIEALDLEKARLTLVDEASGSRTSAHDGLLSLDPGGGHAVLAFRLKDNGRLRLTVVREAGNYALNLQLEALSPAEIGAIAGIDAMTTMALPVSGTVSAKAARDDLHVPFELDLRATDGALRISGTGNMGSPDVTASLEVGGLDQASLMTLWPMPIAKEAREWVAANLASVTVDDGKVEFARQGDAPPSVTGSFAFRDGAVRIKPELPMARQLAGRGSFDTASLVFDLTAGRLSELSLRSAKVQLLALDQDQSRIEVAADANGPVAGAVALAKAAQPDLRQSFPHDAGIAGSGNYSLTLAMPLDDPVDPASIRLTVDATAQDVRLPRLVHDLDVSGGQLTLRVTDTAVAVSGRATLGQMPIERFTFNQSLAPRGEPEMRLTARGALPVSQLQAFGISPQAGVGGSATGEVTWQQARSGVQTGRAVLDLEQLAFTPAGIPIGKKAGRPGNAEADFRLERGRLHLNGVNLVLPEGEIAGNVEVDIGSGRVVSAEARLRRLAGSDLAINVARPAGDRYAIRVTGNRLDLQPWLASSNGASGGGQLPDFDLSLDLTEVLVGRGRLTRVSGSLRADGGEPRSGSVDATLRGGQLARLTMEEREGRRHIKLTAEDAGALLEMIDPLADQAVGGTFNFEAILGELPTEPPLYGKAVMRDFTMVQAPVIARILTMASLSGIVNTLQGRGIRFNHAKLEFELHPGELRITRGKAVGSEVGLTIQGVNNLSQGTVDLNGTVIPIYSLNSLLGRIPIVGTLLRGRDGAGAFAVTFSVRGPQDNPSISVNPLSIVVPGFIRDLTDLLSGPD